MSVYHMHAWCLREPVIDGCVRCCVGSLDQRVLLIGQSSPALIPPPGGRVFLFAK